MLCLVFEGVYSVALDLSLRPWMLSLHHACTHIMCYVKYHFEKENICLHCKGTVGAEWYLTWGLNTPNFYTMLL